MSTGNEYEKSGWGKADFECPACMGDLITDESVFICIECHANFDRFEDSEIITGNYD